jgi:two-component system NarL family sensor kinase
MSLMVTGWLSERNRRYQESLSQQQSKLQAQEQLVRLREDFASTLTHDLKTPLLGAIETLKAFHEGKFGTVTIRNRSGGDQKMPYMKLDEIIMKT